MKAFYKIILTALAVIILANILPGVKVDGFLNAIIVALVISLLNMFVRPLIILFTLPATIITLGLFLFVINAFIIIMADKLIDGFKIIGFFDAFFFSFLLSILRPIMLSFMKEDRVVRR